MRAQAELYSVFQEEQQVIPGFYYSLPFGSNDTGHTGLSLSVRPSSDCLSANIKM